MHRIIKPFCLYLCLVGAFASNAKAGENEKRIDRYKSQANKELFWSQAKAKAPKIALGVLVVTSAVVYDYLRHQGIELQNEGEDTCREGSYSVVDAAMNISSTVLGNSFFLGTICANYGSEFLRTCTSGVEFCVSNFFETRADDANQEAHRIRSLVALRETLNGDIDSGELPESYCTVIAKVVEEQIATCGQSGNSFSLIPFEKIERYYQTIKMLPRRSKPLVYKDLKENLEPLVANFEDGGKEALRLYLRKLCVNSNSCRFEQNEDQKVNLPLGACVYLLGPTGVGKTTFAKSFATILALPFYEINLTSCKKDKLIGLSGYSNGKDLVQNFSVQSTSTLTKALVSMNGQFGVIFIDEVDKALNNSQDYEMGSIKSDLLTFLDPSARSLRLAELGVDIDISKVIFILAGNAEIKSKPLRRRMQTIPFKGFSNEKKGEIVRKNFPTYLAHYQVEESEELSLKEGSKLHDLIKKMIVLDPSAGVRTLLLVLNDLAAWISIQDELDLSKFDYEASFQMYDVTLLKPVSASDISESNGSDLGDQLPGYDQQDIDAQKAAAMEREDAELEEESNSAQMYGKYMGEAVVKGLSESELTREVRAIAQRLEQLIEMQSNKAKTHEVVE